MVGLPDPPSVSVHRLTRILQKSCLIIKAHRLKLSTRSTIALCSFLKMILKLSCKKKEKSSRKGTSELPKSGSFMSTLNRVVLQSYLLDCKDILFYAAVSFYGVTIESFCAIGEFSWNYTLKLFPIVPNIEIDKIVIFFYFF